MDLAKRNSQSKIIFGPGDKLQFLEEVAFDQNATDFDARVAVAIANRTDKHTGAARVGQGTIAKYIGGTERGVRLSVDRLERLGHLGIERAKRGTPIGGRGKANTYRPITRNRVPGFKPETRNGVPGLEAQTRNLTTVNQEGDDTKPGMGVPTLPNTYLNSSLPRSAGALEGASSRWQEIERGLSTKIGEDKAQAWFTGVSVFSETATEVVLLVPQGIRRKHIEGNFMPAIEAVCGKTVRLAA